MYVSSFQVYIDVYSPKIEFLKSDDVVVYTLQTSGNYLGKGTLKTFAIPNIDFKDVVKVRVSSASTVNTNVVMSGIKFADASKSQLNVLLYTVKYYLQMPNIFTNVITTTNKLTTQTGSANAQIGYSIMNEITSYKWIPYYAKFPNISFSNYPANTILTLSLVIKNGSTTYSTTTFTIDPTIPYSDGITIPLQLPLPKETFPKTSTYTVVNRLSEISLSSVATQTSATTWTLHSPLVVLENQCLTIPAGYTLVTSVFTIFNTGTIYLNGIINITPNTTGRFINGLNGLIYGVTAASITGATGVNLNTKFTYLNMSGFALTPVQLNNYNIVEVRLSNRILTIAANQSVSSTGYSMLTIGDYTHMIIQTGGIFIMNGNMPLTNNAIIINYGTIRVQGVLTNAQDGIIINYGTIANDQVGNTIVCNNFGTIANASTGKFMVNIATGARTGIYFREILNYETTSIYGITTTGSMTGYNTPYGKPPTIVTSTIPPLDPTLDTEATLFCKSTTAGKIITSINLNSGMFIQLGGSNVEVNPPNINFPSAITVKTPITYKSGKIVSFSGPPTTGPAITYNMYSSAGVFTVTTATAGSFNFTMPATLTPPIYDNTVAIYANTTKVTGFNPFSIFAKTSIRDYTADLPTNKTVLYACAYNKEPVIQSIISTVIYTNVNITQAVTLDSLDFGYMFPIFRKQNNHKGGFKPTQNAECTFYVGITNRDGAIPNNSFQFNTAIGFDAIYDSADTSGKNDGSLLTIPFTLNNNSLPTYVGNVVAIPPSAYDSALKLKVGDQITISLQCSVQMDFIKPNTVNLLGWQLINEPYNSLNPICGSLICEPNAAAPIPDVVAANFGITTTSITGTGASSSPIIASDNDGIIISGKSILTGFLLNGFKITTTAAPPATPTATIPLYVNIYKKSGILVANKTLIFQIFFDYTESATSTSESPLYIPFSCTEYNRIYSETSTRDQVSRIDATSLCFNGIQNPIFETNNVFYLEIPTLQRIFTFTYKTSRTGTKASGTVNGIIIPDANSVTLQSNSVTLKYNGGLISSSPHFVSASPRGTQETFAVVNNNSLSTIKNYATAIGKLPANRTEDEKTAVTTFTSPADGQLVPFNNIITTFVTYMNTLFQNVGTFNESISSWDTSSVIGMNNMFHGATAFNQPIGIWDTSRVTDMTQMFTAATTFNQPIGSWNTASVAIMQNMFLTATKFNQPIGSWNTASVTIMQNMFGNATAFNQPIGSWNTANVTTMSNMFNTANAFNQLIGSWNTAKVTDMMSMFYNANNFNQDIGGWNTAKVVYMNSMFYNANNFNQYIGSWNTANVIDMNNMFSRASLFNQPIGQWNTANVTDMSNMFCVALMFNYPIGSWNTAKVRNMRNMFENAENFNQYIGGWNTANVTNMSVMFSYAKVFNQKFDSWNTANVTDMNNMFNSSGFNENINNLNVQYVTDMSFMFAYTKFNHPILFQFSTRCRNMSGMFFNNTVFSQTFVSNTGEVTDMSSMFQGATAFNSSISGYTPKCRNMADMFAGATAFNSPVSLNVSSVTNMRGMFMGASKFNQPIEFKEHPSNVTDMSYMFNGATVFNQPLYSINDWFDTRNVTNMSHMFTNAHAFNQKLKFVTNNVQTMDYMLSGARSFNQVVQPQYLINDIIGWKLDNLYSAVGFNTYARPIRLPWRASKTGVLDPSQFTDINGQQIIYDNGE